MVPTFHRSKHEFICTYVSFNWHYQLCDVSRCCLDHTGSYYVVVTQSVSDLIGGHSPPLPVEQCSSKQHTSKDKLLAPLSLHFTFAN